MSEGSAGAGAGTAQRIVAGAGRLARAWRKLPSERRLAAVAAILLFLTLFLPWYQETVIASGTATKLQSVSATLTGWGAFSFVEAAILVIAAGVLVLLYQRAEGRAFHIPGGDGGVIMVAGLWACVLIVWRIFDKQGTSSHGQYATTSGIEWGILVALVIAGLLAYAGSRIRLAHRPEPPLPGERRSPQGPPAAGRAEPRPGRPARSDGDTLAADPVPSDGRPGRARPIRSEDDTLPTPATRSDDDTLPTPATRSDDDTLPTPATRSDDDTLPTPATRSDDDTLPTPATRSDDDTLPTPATRSDDDTLPTRPPPTDDSPTLRMRRRRPSAGDDEQMTIPLDPKTPER
jgi:hypothetical protein